MNVEYMSTTPSKVNRLYREYIKRRGLPLSKEQFSSFMAFYPSLLVVACDGIVDKEEWMYCKKLASGLGTTFANDSVNTTTSAKKLTYIYQNEFKYLLKNLDEWRDKFLGALREHISTNDDAKDFVHETVFIFADASNGISAIEDQTISYVFNELDMEDQT